MKALVAGAVAAALCLPTGASAMPRQWPHTAALPIVRVQAEGEPFGMRGMSPEGKGRSGEDNARSGREANAARAAPSVSPPLESARRAPDRPTKLVSQSATELMKANGNNNSMTIQRGAGFAPQVDLANAKPNGDPPGLSTRVDFAGRPHFDKATGRSIPTPHIVDQKMDVNFRRDGKAYGDLQKGTPRELNQADIRMLRRVTEQRSTALQARRSAAPQVPTAPKPMEPPKVIRTAEATPAPKPPEPAKVFEPARAPASPKPPTRASTTTASTNSGGKR